MLQSYRALLEFETVDPADVHFRLARLLSDDGQRAAAKQNVLMALEEAPRFLDAHRLLLELADADRTAPDVPERKQPSAEASSK